jgi:hypothetical protein
MAATTTTRTGAPRVKPFSWSYSRLKNYRACPKRHYSIDIAKEFKEPEGEQLIWGNLVHDALAKRCGPKREPLPSGMAVYEPWAEKVLVGGGEIEVEQNLALTEEFAACGYFDSNTWFRAKGDFIKRQGPVALIVDWKTGKIIEDSEQLALTAACVFAKHPEVQAVRSSFVWLKEDAETSETFYRSDMPNLWRHLWPEIEQLKQAALHTNYPAKPGDLCRSWCAVTSCPHNGRS